MKDDQPCRKCGGTIPYWNLGANSGCGNHYGKPVAESSKGVDAVVRDIMQVPYSKHKAEAEIKALITSTLDAVLSDMPEKEPELSEQQARDYPLAQRSTEVWNQAIDQMTEVITKHKAAL